MLISNEKPWESELAEHFVWFPGQEFTTSVRENVCNNWKKRKRSCFWILKKKRFKDHLITQPLIHNYRRSVLVSHQHQTSCSEMRTQWNYATENCVWKTPISSHNIRECSAMAQNGSHSWSWELYSDHWAKYVNSFSQIKDWSFANDFLQLLIRHFNKKPS